MVGVLLMDLRFLFHKTMGKLRRMRGKGSGNFVFDVTVFLEILSQMRLVDQKIFS